MADFDSIFKNARSLPPEEQVRLARTLMKERSLSAEADDIGVGERGLASWTDSVRSEEEWAHFYPASLRKRKVG